MSLAPVMPDLPFTPSPEDLTFLRSATGIQDEEQLRAHVVAVQRKALKVFPYPCIQKYSFASSTISRLPGFQKSLLLLPSRPHALLLDIGCCFGASSRSLALAGFPPSQIIASDLHSEFWDLGRELFRDSPSTMPITFLGGDVFDRKFLQRLPNGSAISEAPLEELECLTPLHGRLGVVHAALFFHLFSRTQQQELAVTLASLMLQQPGSLLFGHQVASLTPGTGAEKGRWAHSLDSWEKLWKGAFKEVEWAGGVKVTGKMIHGGEWVGRLGIGEMVMFWNVELV